ncbi:hypothetical protein NP493_25g03000 [Ridgeia piscesae]|uniref:Uncharacterized protein n=1 Tax=Ridgeia piscesae TaxID=27915 RepID=A0AAD9PDK3_RIDPI|nr:hypothetical protein NP493_25g03000 [Ridgeia piscesae]
MSKIRRCCFYHIRDLRRFISVSVAKTIATALVSSTLDYCNSLLYSTANKDIAKLKRVQNSLARVVMRSLRFSRSVPLLKLLPWLPLYNRLSSTLIYTTSISKFDANSSKNFQTATLNQ